MENKKEKLNKVLFNLRKAQYQTQTDIEELEKLVDQSESTEPEIDSVILKLQDIKNSMEQNINQLRKIID